MHAIPRPESTELTAAAMVLRPWRADDAPAMHDAVRESMQSLATWLPWCHPDYGLVDAQARIDACHAGWAQGELFSFATLDDEGRLLGSVGLSQVNRLHRSANAGYWLRTSAQGHGWASRALARVARFGFEQLGLIRVEIVAEPGNVASRRTAEQAGARFEVIARNKIWSRDRPADAAVYSLVPGDLAQP
jgi:RimJ/RimL family protein N-acetyltransferase